MSDFLYAVPAFILAIAILVSVHEFGHFWVARKMGVKVLRFSLGFGKPIYTRQMGKDADDQFEFAICALPLGGYVKMLDEREGEVAEKDLPRAFNRQPIWPRVAIVLAGPMANFLFAIVAFWVAFQIGNVSVRPLVGGVVEASPAERAGFQTGDAIRAVNGEAVESWEAVHLAVMSGILDSGDVSMTVASTDGLTVERTLRLGDDAAQQNPLTFFNTIGFQPDEPNYPLVVRSLTDGLPAQAAGLQVGDQILSVNGVSFRTSNVGALIDLLQPLAGESIPLLIARPSGRQLEIRLRPKQVLYEGKQVVQIGVGFERPPEDVLRKYLVKEQSGPFEAVGQAVGETYRYSALVLKGLGKMLIGEASLKNINGPLTIGEVSGKAVQQGWYRFIFLLALISISLGVINLLPIPLLDGGHLLYYLIEFVRGAPLSEAAQLVGVKIGMLVLLMVMSLALFNDFSRLLFNT